MPKIPNPPLTGPAALLKPTVKKTGKTYICQLTYLIGTGATPEEAVDHFNNNLQPYLAAADEDDEIVKLIRAIVEPPALPIDELHAKFGLRPVDKSKRRT